MEGVMLHQYLAQVRGGGGGRKKSWVALMSPGTPFPQGISKFKSTLQKEDLKWPPMCIDTCCIYRTVSEN